MNKRDVLFLVIGIATGIGGTLAAMMVLATILLAH